MATIQKRGNSYQIKASCGYDTSGKQVLQTMTWKPDSDMTPKQIEKELNRQAVLFEQECRNGKTTSVVKFEDFGKRWFKEYAQLSLKTRTIQSYEQLTKRIYTAIGHLRMDKITPRDIQKFILNLSEDKRQDRKVERDGKLSPKTIKHHVSLISTIFDYAIKMQVVSNNPCRAVVLPRPNQKERDVYTVEEAQKLLELLEQEEERNFKFVVFFTMAMYTGLRRGELLGLEWRDFDFNYNIVTVSRSSSWHKDKGMFADTPKTKTSMRSLKLPQNIIDLLLRFREYQNRERVMLGDKWEEHDRLFTRWNGAPMFPNTPQLYFGRFCKRTGMRFVNIHSWRHFAASVMVYSGTDVKTVQSVLGHSSPTTTMNLYLHSFQMAQVKAMDAISNALMMKEAN